MVSVLVGNVFGTGSDGAVALVARAIGCAVVVLGVVRSIAGFDADSANQAFVAVGRLRLVCSS